MKGFTLVELIIVIAIIAILSAISVVGFTRFIESARFSNDNELASQMTRLVQAHIQGTGDTDLDANDVRTIVSDNTG
ncbi:MAG: prepilin-type N-terminal cleavage/methylation domain-containing protein, partial [Acholeplasmataceae bacterium]